MMKLNTKNRHALRRNISCGILLAFVVNAVLMPVSPAFGQEAAALPLPGDMVSLSASYQPIMLKGLKVFPQNPFEFAFILDPGDANFTKDQFSQESNKLVKYFMASVTIPENDLWVNLSPYEKDRIVADSFGITEMGRDLLAQDYILKQVTASLIYPEHSVGKEFWKRVYEEAAKKYGTTDIPVDTFNKVWIVPGKAKVYENVKAGTVFIIESSLKVMLQEDYLALEKSHSSNGKTQNLQENKQVNLLGSKIVREIVIPALTKEVNEGKNFAALRQVYQALILATWYKMKIKDSILSQVYADQKKVAGISIDDPKEKQKIYQRYLDAFQKGVYNYIKEEVDPFTQEMTPKKYFSGGVSMEGEFAISRGIEVVTNQSAGSAVISPWLTKALKTSLAVVFVAVTALSANAQRVSALEAVNSQVQNSSSENDPGARPDVSFKKNSKGEFSVAVRSGLSAQQQKTAILFEAMSQLSDSKIDPDLKSFLQKSYPDAVAKVRWAQNKAAKVLLAKFDRLNKGAGLFGDITRAVDNINAQRLVVEMAARSKNEQEFTILMNNFVKFKMVRSILQSPEVSLKLLQWRIDHENRKNGKSVTSDKRPLAVVIVDTADWNGALKDKAAIGNEKSFVESLISQGYRVLMTEADNFNQVLASIEDFTQFGRGVLFLNAHGNPETLGGWVALPTAAKKYTMGTGRVIINSILENQYAQMLEGRVSKVVLYSCSTGGTRTPNQKNIADFIAKIMGAATYAPQEPIHRVDFGKDGSVNFYTKEFGYGGMSFDDSERRAESYIAQPPKPNVSDKPKAPKSASSSGIDQEVGGIDLTKNKMDLEVDNQAALIKFQLDPATLKKLRDSVGFNPVIFNVAPMEDLSAFLGIQG